MDFYSYTKVVLKRIFRFWLHPQIIYDLTNFSKEQKFAEENMATSFAKDIMNNARHNMKNEENSKVKNFIRALLDEKNSLPEIEIEDEVKTLILTAQGILKKLIEKIVYLIKLIFRHIGTHIVIRNFVAGNAQGCSR
jgi:hypothetical protein